MSFHVSDAERLAALHTAARFGRRKRRDWFSLRRGRRVNAWDRRGSNTSEDSNLSNLGSMVSEVTGLFLVNPSCQYKLIQRCQVHWVLGLVYGSVTWWEIWRGLSGISMKKLRVILVPMTSWLLYWALKKLCSKSFLSGECYLNCVWLLCIRYGRAESSLGWLLWASVRGCSLELAVPNCWDTICGS